MRQRITTYHSIPRQRTHLRRQGLRYRATTGRGHSRVKSPVLTGVKRFNCRFTALPRTMRQRINASINTQHNSKYNSTQLRRFRRQAEFKVTLHRRRGVRYLLLKRGRRVHLHMTLHSTTNQTSRTIARHNTHLFKHTHHTGFNYSRVKRPVRRYTRLSHQPPSNLFQAGYQQAPGSSSTRASIRDHFPSP